MLNHVVKSGESLSQIAYKFQTTTSIIAADNPIIKDKNRIQAGWNLKIRTSAQYVKDQAKKATGAKSSASAAKPVQVNVTQTGAIWGGSAIQSGQIGRVTITGTANLWKLDTKGKLIKIRTLSKNAVYRVYSYLNKDGGLYNVGGNQWVYKTSVKYETIPANLSNSTKPGSSNAIGKITPDNKSKQADQIINLSPTIPAFENPYYRRPVLQAKRSDGKVLNVELRVLAVSNSYSNQIQQSKTNSGFFINVAGYNLPVMTINGAFLDSKGNKEFDDFLDRYLEYMQSYKSGKFYSFSICSFYYKNREYKGLVAGFNYTDTQEQPFHKNFSLQFLILKEKRLVTDAEITAIPTVVPRGGMTEEQYLSDIGMMLKNPITGLYGMS